MRLIEALLTALLLEKSTSSLVIERRQLKGLLTGKPETPVKIENISPRIRPNAKRQLIRYGPFILPAVSKNTHDVASDSIWNVFTKTMDPHGFVINFSAEGICKNCTILAAKADATLENGTRADINDGVYIHHILAFDTGKKAPDFANYCPRNGKNAMMNAFSGLSKLPPLFLAGAENEYWVWYTSPDGKENSGYHIPPKGGNFAVQSELVNYKDTPQEVYLTFDLEFLPGEVGRDSLFTMLVVTGCDSAGYRSNELQNSMTSGQWPVRSNGKLINMRGHLHDGGVAMELFVNGKMVCRSDAVYGGKGGTMTLDGMKWESISAMTDCNSVIPLKKGDVLTMKSIYDLKTHPLRENHGGGHAEEMGLMTFSFVPD